MIARTGARKQFELVAQHTHWTGPEKPAEPIDVGLPYGAELSAKGLYLPTNLQLEKWVEVDRSNDRRWVSQELNPSYALHRRREPSASSRKEFARFR